MDYHEVDGAGRYDPDLEARLYAEIHYSKDSYPDHMDNLRTSGNNHNELGHSIDNRIPLVNNQYPALPPRFNPHGVNHNSWVIDTRPTHISQHLMYPRNHQRIGLTSNATANLLHPPPLMSYPRNNEMYSKTPRPLLNDIYPPGIPQPISYGNYPHSSLASIPPLISNYDDQYPIRTRHPPNVSSSRFNNNIPTNTKRKHRKSSKKNKTREPVKKPAKSTLSKDTTKPSSVNNNPDKNSNQSECTNPKPIETDKSSNTAVQNDQLPKTNEDSTSKYDVMAKLNQPTQINPSASAELPSDSDESILEVPVPPKPEPPLINLRDSDESSSSDDDDDDDEQSPVIMNQKSPELPQPPPIIVDEDTNSSTQIISTTITTAEVIPEPQSNIDNMPANENNENNENNEKSSDDVEVTSDNILINCTQITTGVATLADIRRLRENVKNTSSTISDDDSMTESEAMKWRQIDNQISDNQSDKISDHRWNQLVQNTEVNLDKTIDDGIVAQPTSQLIETTAQIIDKSPINKSNVEVNTRRKRSRSMDSIVETPEKQNNTSGNKSKTRKSTRVMPTGDWLFQPLPKKLEAYYNEPRGDMMTMDVGKIQSSMSQNPSHWAILGADKRQIQLRGKKKKCSVCQCAGHTRDKCPNHQHVPTCHMCGEIGHYEPRCPYSMCLTCGAKFSAYRKTCENCRNIQCSLCKSQGHAEDNCPDLWRRYHQTTTGTSVIVPINPTKILKPPNQLSCCNCTKNGHHSTNCKKYRWSQHFLSPRFVTSYTKGPSYTPDIVSIDDDYNTSTDYAKDDSLSVYEIESPILQSNILYVYLNDPNNMIESWQTTRISLKEFTPHHMIDQWRKHFNPPIFLQKLFPQKVHCEFNVIIQKLKKKNYELILKAANGGILIILEKILTQWLNCRDITDQNAMNDTDHLPVTKKELFELLSEKTLTLVKYTQPKKLQVYRWFTHAEKQLRRKDIEPDERNKLITQMMNCKIIMSSISYNYGIIQNAHKTLNELLILLRGVAHLPIKNCDSVPSIIYMSAVWFTFELFSPRITHKVFTAAIKGSKEQLKDDPTVLEILKKGGDCKKRSPFPSIIKLPDLTKELELLNIVLVNNPIDSMAFNSGQTSGNQIESSTNIHNVIENTTDKCNDNIILEQNKHNESVKIIHEVKKKKVKVPPPKKLKNIKIGNMQDPVATTSYKNKTIVKYAKAAHNFIKGSHPEMIPYTNSILYRARLGFVQVDEIIRLWRELKLMKRKLDETKTKKNARKKTKSINNNGK